MLIIADRCNDRKKILFQHIKEDLRIDLCDISDKADILSVGIFLLNLQKSAVLAA